jgi:CubicO group peptidase (beta-lactamase class C family)
MKNITCVVAFGLIILPLAASGQTPAAQDKLLTPSEQMDKLFDFWNRLDQPGFAVTVVKGGQVVYQKVFGLACQEHAVAMTPNSLFNTATLAQAFTGQAVAMLEPQGKLGLDDDVRKFIPELPDFGSPVRLRHLVYHSSGLRDWLPVLELTGRTDEEVTFEKVLKLVKAQKRLIFPPGERWEYSATNYDLLAEVVKRATGVPFSDWARENIFKPLKMTRTQFRDNYRSILDDQALSYNFTRKEYLRGIDNLSLTGSHSLFASIAELSKWLLSLETGQTTGPDIQTKMFTAGKLNNGAESAFGYGLRVGMNAGRRQVSLTGEWAGSGVSLAYFPDQKFGFVVLANWDYTPVEGFTQDIAEIYMPPAAAAPQAAAKPAASPKTSLKVGPAVLDRYLGTYRLGPGQVFLIGREGSQLFLGFSGQKFPLAARSETEFYLEIAAAKIVFEKGSAGQYDRLVWTQSGTEQVAPKVVLVRPTPQELGEYAGAYFNEELNLAVGIELRGAGLVVLPPEQAEVRLGPDEKDRFVSSAHSFPMIMFRRDAKNRITGFTIDADSLRDLVFMKR